jgi:hypothetical protein
MKIVRTVRVVAGTLAAAVLVVHAAGRPRSVSAAQQEGALLAASSMDCPEGTIPDEGVCVHTGEEDSRDAPIGHGAHRERSGRWAVYDQVPRRPDRPADYDAYQYPVPPGLANGHSVLSGYDLDRPDPQQRRGRRIRAVGHGGVDIPQAKGTPVRMIRLDHQEGDADVLYTGPLFGTTVVTHHVLREGGELRDYILLFGHLEGWPPGLEPGMSVRDGDTIGFVGDTGSPELVHLHLEARRVREGVSFKAAGPALVQDAVSIVCDPRNVLPLR